jgi:hypothetical protein
MENSLYYTFSTIAQVLAGFLALSGVFVLYQFERYLTLQTYVIKSYIKDYLQKYAHPDVLMLIRQLEDTIGLNDFSTTYNSLIEFSENTSIKPLGDLSKAAISYANSISNIQSNKIKLLNLTRASLLIGVSIILYSLVILANVDYIIINCIDNRFWLFTVGIIGASISLGLMSYAILISLKVKTK